MAGLFDTLNLGARSLATYRKAIDTTGHNLANVNTTGYTRQRLLIESVTTDTGMQGRIGAGADAAKVIRLHNEFANAQIQTESSIEGSLAVREDALRQALTVLQEGIDRNGENGTSTKGISQAISDFFTGVQSLSTEPDKLAARQVFLQQAQELATRFNQADARLSTLQRGLDGRVAAEADSVNSLTGEIARLNAAIASEEALSQGFANTLRDSRQLKLEELSKLVKFDASEQPGGAINISVGGNLLVDGINRVNTIETFQSGDFRQVRIQGQAEALVLTGGSIHGAISTRDTHLANLRSEINLLAESFISEVNQAHSEGFSLTGTTGANLFDGASAAEIRVNSTILRDPSLLQTAGAPGEPGNNSILLRLARLGNSAQAALNGETFSEKHARTIAALGKDIATARSELQDQQTITRFIRNQRDAVSGVSIDEEMTNLVMFQKAFQASAKLISMTDEMLGTIIQM